MFNWIGEAMEKMWRSMSFGMLSWMLDTVSGFVDQIILPISKMSFINNEYLNTAYKAFSDVAVLLLVPITLFALISASVKGEIAKQIKTITLGILVSILVITGAKPLTMYLSDYASDLSVAMVNDGDVSKLDNTILEVYLAAANSHMSNEEVVNFIEDYKQPNFDYNAKNGDAFVYTLNIFPSLIFGFIILFLLLYMALQMLYRTISIAFALLLAPFSAIPKVAGDNNSFSYVSKQILYNLVMNMLQLFIIVFAMMFINSFTVRNALLKILIVIVAFLFILQAPNMVAGLTGGSQGSLLNSAQSALLGANAGRALIAGGVGAVASIGSGLANAGKGLMGRGGGGIMGTAGSLATAPLRGASGFVRGTDKTMFGKDGSPATTRGAQARQKLSDFGYKLRGSSTSQASNESQSLNSEQASSGQTNSTASTSTEAPSLRGSETLSSANETHTSTTTPLSEKGTSQSTPTRPQAPKSEPLQANNSNVGGITPNRPKPRPSSPKTNGRPLRPSRHRSKQNKRK